MSNPQLPDSDPGAADERWRLMEHWFQSALELDPGRRASFLERCPDASLRREVASLLGARDRAGSFLSRPVLEAAPHALLAPWADTATLRGRAAEPASAAPMPERIGPYRVLRRLGHGGMGTVNLGQHEQTGERAAVKTVRVPDERLLAGIRREVQALARLRHPGIVRILEEGLEAGAPWYAMELLDGVTLRLAREAGSLRDAPLGVLLGVARRLCAPLGFLHGEGLVHRDLKPDNVLLVDGARGTGDGSEGTAAARSGFDRDRSYRQGSVVDSRSESSLPSVSAWPVIVDFGLASQWAGAAGRESLEVGGGISGTVAYMAPEQARGELVDARADLYSLGCILYELVTGRPPFLGRSSREVLEQHLTAVPAPPSAWARGVPPELDALVLRLLAKEPHRRLGYTQDVAGALAGLGAEIGIEQTDARPRDYLYRPRFQGRGPVLAELLDRLTPLRKGGGSAVFIGGESGAGKTRLAVELAACARQQGVCVLTGESQPPGGQGGGPLHPLRRPLQAIGDRCRGRGGAESMRLLGPRSKLLALFEPSLAGLPGLEHMPEPAELPAEAARLRLYTYLADTLAALGEAEPVLLVLDDLQWADELTLGLLGFLVHGPRLASQRLLLLGTYRPEEAGSELQALSIASGVTRLDLGRLEQEAVRAIVSDMLALEAPPEAFVHVLNRHAEGNPYFAAEVVRAALEEGLLRRDLAGCWQLASPADRFEALAVPRTLRELAGRRLEMLPPLARAVVQAAAVLGRESEGAALADVAGLPESALSEALAEPLRCLVLEETPGGRLRFVHDQLRDAAYGSLPPQIRPHLHRSAAVALARTVDAAPGPERAQHLGALGHHWEQAGETTRAAEAYLGAARAARDRHAHQESARLYRKYLELAPSATAEAIAARMELAWDVLRVWGLGREGLAELEAALILTRGGGLRVMEAQVLARLGSLYHELGDFEQARPRLEHALALAREASDAPLEGRVLSYLVLIHHDQGRVEQAEAMYSEALRIARQIGDRWLEGRVLNNLANVHHEAGRLEESRALLEQAVAIYREIEDRPTMGLLLGNLASLLVVQGRMDEAAPLLKQALAIHREVGARRHEGHALGNLGTLLAEQRRLDEAREWFEQALRVYREVGARRYEGGTRTNLANLHKEQGRIEEARSQYEAALTILRRLGDQPYCASALRNLAMLERQCYGRLDEAERLVRESRALVPAQYALERLACLVELGHLELARGRSAGTRIEEIQAKAAELDVEAQSPLGQAIARLLRAQDEFTSGGPLFRGDRVEDLTEGLRRWLVETDQLPRAES